MSKTQGLFKPRALKTTVCAVVALFLLSGALPASAINDGCVPTPRLDGSHKVTDKSLGQAVKALAWQWQPGSDADNAALSSLGTKVSVVTGNLRQIRFGVLHNGIPRSQDLRDLTQGNYQNIAAINGDYFDENGPWSAMVQDAEVLYAPPGSSSVVGMTSHKVSSRTGYRSSGTLTLGNRKFNVTGVNQLNPGPSSIVVYQSDFARPKTPRGQVSLVIKSGKISKVFPKGAALPTNAGTVIQVSGSFALAIGKLKAKSTAKLVLPAAPKYEARMSAGTIAMQGSISSKTNTLYFNSVNFTNLSNSGATLFDDNYLNVTKRGNATLRITKDNSGNLVVRDVYKYGSALRVDTGGYVIQITGSRSAAKAARFKVGDTVLLSRSYESSSNSEYISAAGRGPRVLEGGKFVWICAAHNKDLRPRSAIGWNLDGQVWLITSSRGFDAIDLGFRQGGSTTSQMGEWLLELGATDAVLLDGGGSTTMQINDPNLGWKRFDLPDSAWYRELANAFSIESKS